MKDKLAHMVGELLAEHLISKCIPSLSCEQCTVKLIQVTWGEAEKSRKLRDAWFDKLQSLKRENKSISDSEANKLSEDEWNEDMEYRYTLKEKYLPHSIKCRTPYSFSDFDEATMKIVKKGLINGLWDWDFCDWSLREEDIVLDNEFIILKLDLEAPSSYTGNNWIKIKTPQKEI